MTSAAVTVPVMWLALASAASIPATVWPASRDTLSAVPALAASSYHSLTQFLGWSTKRRRYEPGARPPTS